MIEYLLHDKIQYPMLGYILNYGIYYPLILTAFIVCITGIYRRLLLLGYDRKKVLTFLGIILAMTYPAAILSARAANMFYYPVHFWSFSFFLEQLVSGKFVTFHAGIFLPLIIIIALTFLMEMKFWEIMDLFFLYIPLGHAIGRVGCFLVGCCWGNKLSIEIFGTSLSFQNPIPLYSVFLNTVIFFVMRHVYKNVYNGESREYYGGIMVSLYLLLYGNTRLILEIFRKEMIVARGLSQAQVVMITFLVTGILLLLYILMRKKLMEKFSGEAYAEKKRLLVSVSAYILFVIFIAAVSYNLLVHQVVKWPFHKVKDISEAYQTILEYSPVMMIALVTLAWLKCNRIPIAAMFRLRAASWLFFIGIAGSFAYVVYVLYPLKFGIYNLVFWPPVIILSILNALSEEIIFRLVFFRLIRGLTEKRLAANILQSALYASFHVFIGGPVFGAAAFAYGLVLGYMMEESDSIVPALVCHFIIDLGAIGAPLLSS